SAHEADECKSEGQREHVCLSGGYIFDDHSLLSNYQNDEYPLVPFPSRLKKQKKDDEWEKFLSIFKHIHINLPLLEALNQMPKRAKVLKDLHSNKAKLESAASSVTLSKECSTTIQKNLPKKKGDPRSFTLPCLIGTLSVKNALADLGASINPMPYSFFLRLGISKLKPTMMSIQLADRSIKYPIGICENILVKIDKFIFLVDFVILEMDEDASVLIILERPFLAMARTFIDDDCLYFADHTDELVQQQWIDTLNHDSNWINNEEENDAEEVQAASFYPRKEPIKPLEWKVPENKLKPSMEEPPKVELKALPDHLEYVFLQRDDQLLVVISSSLSPLEKNKLLKVMKSHKKAIAWGIFDIKGIDPSFYTHKILMEEVYKPCVQPQRRLNPNMKEIVKKEVIKLLDAGIIYPYLIVNGSFDHCLSNLDKMLTHCEENNLVLNWEKCHFMVKEGIVLGHKISRVGIEVDRAKIKAISKPPHPTNVKSIRSFLGHAGFYHRFIKGFSKISRPMTQLLIKDAKFNFFVDYVEAFEILKKELTKVPIMVKPDWSLLFELMCDASDYAIVYIDHSALRYLFSKQDAHPRLIRWILLLQEFDIEIRDKKVVENLAADHLSRLENHEIEELNQAEIDDTFLYDTFPDESLIKLDFGLEEPWFADFANYLAIKRITKWYDHPRKEEILF
ncbi:reverse transcriptase domain-containing protein, partial [Tanacetum coccineum]